MLDENFGFIDNSNIISHDLGTDGVHLGRNDLMIFMAIFCDHVIQHTIRTYLTSMIKYCDVIIWVFM